MKLSEGNSYYKYFYQFITIKWNSADIKLEWLYQVVKNINKNIENYIQNWKKLIW